MGADDGLYDIQPQAPAVPVLGAALIQLVEPVKDQRQLFRRDGVSIVGDGDIGFRPALLDLQAQRPLLRAELHGVVDQVVDDLGDIVLVGEGEHRVVRHIHLNVDMPVVDLLLEGQQHLTACVLQIELNLFLVRNALLGLELRDIQHTADQPAEPLGLIGDDLQIVGPFFLGDGLIQHTVHIAGNGGHGGLQLMGHIGHELLTAVLALLETGGHIVEGQSQLLHLLGIVFLDLHPGFQLPVAEGVGHFRHFLQGLALPAGKEGHRQHRGQHHQSGNGQEDIGDPGQHRVDPRQRGRDDQDAQRLPLVAENGACHQKALIVIKALDQARGPVQPLRNDFIQVILVYIKSLVPAFRQIVGADDDLPLGVADHRIGSGDLGGHIQIHKEFPAAQAVFIQTGGRQVGNDLGVLLQTLKGGLGQVLLHHHLEGPAQHGQGHQKDPGEHGKAASKRRFHRQSILFPADAKKERSSSSPAHCPALFPDRIIAPNMDGFKQSTKNLQLFGAVPDIAAGSLFRAKGAAANRFPARNRRTERPAMENLRS